MLIQEDMSEKKDRETETEKETDGDRETERKRDRGGKREIISLVHTTVMASISWQFCKENSP